MNIDLDAHYAISDDAISQFARDGFIKLKNVLSAETLKHYGDEITRLTIALNTQHLPLEERSTYDKAFLQVMNLWQSSGLVKEFVMGKCLARIASELLQVKGVRLYHDQSLYKEPNGGITPAHADQYYWPLASDRCITAWIPLQAVPQTMGPLEFFAKSHLWSSGRDLGISDESEKRITSDMLSNGFELKSGAFDLGDVSFHLGWTFHRAGANVSSNPRSVMTIIYMDSDMLLKEPTNDVQKGDWAQWCPGAEVGKVIQTPLNPVIYQS